MLTVLFSNPTQTPLNGIIGINQLLAETALNAEQRELIELTRNSANVLLSLINDVLDLTRVEAGKLVLEYTDFDVREIVEEALESVAVAAIGKGLEVVSYIQPDVPTLVRGDRGRLKQVVLNFLSNAQKFTLDGEIVVQLHILPGPSDQQTKNFHFLVTDTGIGIDREGQAQVFNRFTQVDDSTTRKFGGTGLGLAISKQLIELMNGSIGVQSKKGKGSTFWCLVPLQTVSPPSQQTLKISESTKVLLLFKNESKCRSYGNVLLAWGFTNQVVATDLEEARQLFLEHTFDFVLTGAEPQLQFENLIELKRSSISSGHWIVLVQRGDSI